MLQVLEGGVPSSSLVEFHFSTSQSSDDVYLKGSGAKSEQQIAEGLDQDNMCQHRVYGGFFPWVGVTYELHVAAAFSPLQLLNKFTGALLLPRTLMLDSDGGFCRPEDKEPLFPIGGIDLRWRWDAPQHMIVIDFTRNGDVLDWRWDECRPSKDLRWPSLVPDWSGTGHVGSSTFQYSLTAVVDTIQTELDLTLPFTDAAGSTLKCDEPNGPHCYVISDGEDEQISRSSSWSVITSTLDQDDFKEDMPESYQASVGIKDLLLQDLPSPSGSDGFPGFVVEEPKRHQSRSLCCR